MFCHHYIAYLVNFRTENRGFLVLFYTVPDDKNIKLPSPLPLVALFVPILLGIVPPKALAESHGAILYFSTRKVYVS